MTDTDLSKIEAALRIVLPAAYRKLVVPFPVPAYAGNADTELWDDADRLVELNRELRSGGSSIRPWPAHLFSMGRDGSGCASALDLQSTANPVWWADRCHLNTVGSGPVSASLAEWGERYVAELRENLDADCLDPDGPPEQRERAAEESAGAGGHLILVVAGLAALVALAVWSVLRWLGI